MTNNPTSIDDDFNSFINEYAEEAKCFGRASLPTISTLKAADIFYSVSMEEINIDLPLPRIPKKPLLSRLQAPTVSSAGKSMAPFPYLTRKSLKPSSILPLLPSTVSSSNKSSPMASPSSSNNPEKSKSTMLAPTISSIRKSVTPIPYSTKKILKPSSLLPDAVSSPRKSTTFISPPSPSKKSEKPLLSRLLAPTISSLGKTVQPIDASRTSISPTMASSLFLESTRKSLALSTPSSRLFAPTISSTRKSLAASSLLKP